MSMAAIMMTHIWCVGERSGDGLCVSYNLKRLRSTEEYYIDQPNGLPWGFEWETRTYISWSFRNEESDELQPFILKEKSEHFSAYSTHELRLDI